MIERNQIEQLVREALTQRLGTAAAEPTIFVPAVTTQAKPSVSMSSISVAEADVVDETAKRVITESDVLSVPVSGTLLVRAEVVITPAARDALQARQVTLRQRTAVARVGPQRIVALGADHGGFESKQHLQKLLAEWGYATRDYGTFSTEAVDYPDFAHAVARAVADGHCDLGIVIDGAGIGSCMAANKVPGVRAALCYDAATARNSREHNYANVLTLGGKLQTTAQLSEIVRVWLETPEGEARHGKRVAKIMAIEKQYRTSV